MSYEIERKFLLDKLPEGTSDCPSLSLTQGYLALEPEGHEIRLRRSHKAFWLTVKSSGALRRKEYEVSISEEQFDQLWPATEGRRIEKDRYLLNYQEHKVEIDVYKHPLHGLIVAEVEFHSDEEALLFEPPPWMGQEVTHLNFLKNRNLLQFKSVHHIKELL
jgi:adenylate cyclase